MRRLLAASLVPVLVACKKEPPPPTTGAVTTAASIAATPSAAPRPAATPLPEGATISLRYTGTFKMIESSGAIILDAGEVFYTLDDDGPHQLKDLRRGTRSERQNSAFSGRPGECFFVNRWDQSAETGHQRVNQPMKRTGDFWAAVEPGSSDDPSVVESDVLAWKDGRHLADLHSANRPGSLSLYQACGKGAGSVPSFSPFPKSTPAIDIGAPGEKAPPTPKGSAAPSASSSPSTSASAGAAPTPPAPTEPPAKEPEPDRCPQRLTWASDESPSCRLAIAPAGEVFVVGRDCAAPEKEISSSIVVERWDANGKKLGIEKLPTKAMPSHLLAAAKDIVFALGGDQKRGQVVRFDGTSWTTEETPIEARITRAAVDASGALWLLAGGQVWRRSPSGAYQRATLPEGTGEVKAIAATGQRVWLALQNKLLSSGPAAAPVAIEAVEITKYKGSDYTDYAAGPFCGTPYVKVGLVKQAGADVDKAFPDLRAPAQLGWEIESRSPLRALTGAAGGISVMVKSDRLSGTARRIELWQTPRAPLATGDLLRLEAGCDKRAETCRLKFGNFQNFRAFPHIPGRGLADGLSPRGPPRQGGQSADGAHAWVAAMRPREAAVAQARLWIGTPYVHQASCQCAGADCLGLIRGIWRHLYGQEPCAVPAYTADWAEAGREERLLHAAEHWLRPKPLGEAALGDVLLFRMRAGGMAKHLGLQSGIGAQAAFIHAYSGHSVTESALSAPWQSRVAARFAFPEGAD